MLSSTYSKSDQSLEEPDTTEFHSNNEVRVTKKIAISNPTPTDISVNLWVRINGSWLYEKKGNFFYCFLIIIIQS